MQTNPESAAVEAVAWRVLEIGNRGAAYDPRDAKRAFTYDHQPGNIDASKLGRATEEASRASAGDSIDRGLSLLKALQAEGFGVFQVGPETQSALDALRGEVERLRASVSILEAFVGNVRTECFDYFNEGIRPWPHHMQTLAWRADEAIKSSQTLTKESP